MADLRRTLEGHYEVLPLGMTLDTRQRQFHDEDRSGGNQPANIRVIDRRHIRPPVNSPLEKTKASHTKKRDWTWWYLTGVKTYQERVRVFALLGEGVSLGSMARRANDLNG